MIASPAPTRLRFARHFSSGQTATAMMYAVAMDQVKRTRVYPIIRDSLPATAEVCNSHTPSAHAGGHIGRRGSSCVGWSDRRVEAAQG